MIRASIIGASGYTGGEVLRLLTDHPSIEIHQATSRQYAGRYVYQVHPNLRKRADIKFVPVDALEPADIYFTALPHGELQKHIAHWTSRCEYLVDLSADFRLRDADVYEAWYGTTHEAADWLPKFVYGLPELHRQTLATARYVSGVGCNATACNLALWPLIQAGMLDLDARLIAEVKVGSSEGGASGNPGSHHPERSGVIRTYAPVGHRHTAEVLQEMGVKQVSLTMTSVDLVRGALATVHGNLKPGVVKADLWKAYRRFAEDNPFVRLVKENRGVYRYPEPKILAGTNFADVGFDLDEIAGHVVMICAIDNLMKGSAGSAVQSANLMLGLPEEAGLTFTGLHPI